MSVFDVISLFGGLAMFLYGMRLMGDALKENSSGALKTAMEKATGNPVVAFFFGLLITALIQSSTATIVITSGLVAAGIMTLRQSLGVIVGAKVGTTVTGQIIRLLDLDNNSGVSEWLKIFQPSTLAPIALIIGITLLMASSKNHVRSIGNIAIGFGILFSGLLSMTAAVNVLKESDITTTLFTIIGDSPFLGYVVGAGIAFVLQSSSAAVGILQAFSATGLLSFHSIYAIIVGIYLGDCVTTAIVCSIGSKADAKRVGMVNILFNLGKSVLALVVVNIVHGMGLLDGLWDKVANSGLIANTNTVFNLAGAVLLFPLMFLFEKLGNIIVRDDKVKPSKYQDILDGLNPVFFSTPALSLRSINTLLAKMFELSKINIEKSFKLIQEYEDGIKAEILEEEDSIDGMTDRVSRYMVELQPHLQSEEHVSVLNQYYKLSSEFERLGDCAVNMADIGENMRNNSTKFSAAARHEMMILQTLIYQIIDKSDMAFSRNDQGSATEIEPLVRVANELIAQMRNNHFARMSAGECSYMADAAFSNVMMECKRICSVCSNIGVATIIRFRPELTDHEHLYYEGLQKSGNAEFNATFEKAYDLYLGQLLVGADIYDATSSSADKTSEPSVKGQISLENLSSMKKD